MAAPVPIPAAIKRLRGNPGQRAIPPEVEVPRVTELPQAPDWLGEVGQAEWYRVTECLMEMGILGRVDFEPLAGYCYAVEVRRGLVLALREAVEAGDLVVEEEKTHGGGTRRLANPLIAQEREASKQVLRHAIEFGFTPAARARIRPEAVGQKSKFGNLVEQSGDAKRRGEETRKASN